MGDEEIVDRQYFAEVWAVFITWLLWYTNMWRYASIESSGSALFCVPDICSDRFLNLIKCNGCTDERGCVCRLQLDSV